MTGIIPLTRGFQATVSDCDYEWIKNIRWYTERRRYTTYARTSQFAGSPRLHAMIMNPPAGYVVHHKDRNGLNCVRDNLVVVTQSQNVMLNSLMRDKKGSKYRGVDFIKANNKFRAEVCINYKRHYLGVFKTEEEAALAYNEACKQLLGEGNFEPNILE